ncbi:MAG TPA: prolipoprotein diacylglyceryl transferase family protein, partial [Anaerolineales bacterium]|nr:prolipoprotein diacylglyceryl transferase family protein [Anaerolineales bacterium]
MFPILQLGPLAIQVPGLVLLVSLWLGLALAEREAKRLNLNADAIYTLALTGLIAGVIGARLAYAACYPGAYLRDPFGLFSLNPSALAQTDGMLIGLVAAYVYGARRKLPWRPTLDALAPALAALMIGEALAHIASGDAFGAPARLSWSIFLWGDYRHPSQFYELAGSLVVLGMWAWRRDRVPFPGGGFLFV